MGMIGIEDPRTSDTLELEELGGFVSHFSKITSDIPAKVLHFLK